MSKINIPAGWKLVPVEPTEAMLIAARDWSICKLGRAVGNDGSTGCYAAMLAAAPTPPVDAVLGEPVAWVNLATLISAKIAKERGAADEQHTWCESKTSFHDTPLYERVPNSPDNPPRLRRDGESLIDYRAAMGWGAPLAAPVASRDVQAEPVNVSVEKMVESGNGVSWWVVLRRGPARLDDGKYGAEFKNRAEWRAAELRWILGQGDKPNIRNFMDISPTAPAATAEPDMRAICESLGFDPTNHHNAARCPYCRPASEGAASLAPREPLTDARIRDIWDTHVGEPTANYPWSFDDFANFARAVEREIAASPARAEGAGSWQAQPQFKVEIFSNPRGGFSLETGSLVRVTHTPTGMMEECAEERSQHRNHRVCLDRLRDRLKRRGLCSGCGRTFTNCQCED